MRVSYPYPRIGCSKCGLVVADPEDPNYHRIRIPNKCPRCGGELRVLSIKRIVLN